MKYVKGIVVFLFLLIVVPLIFYLGLKLLPNSVRYHEEIKYGNQYVERLLQYKQTQGNLPESTDYEILQELNPEPSKELFYPQYDKIDELNFSLTYIIGFDGPYFTYNTLDKEWKLK